MIRTDLLFSCIVSLNLILYLNVGQFKPYIVGVLFVPVMSNRGNDKDIPSLMKSL